MGVIGEMTRAPGCGVVGTPLPGGKEALATYGEE